MLVQNGGEKSASQNLAERVGFEPTVRLRVHMLSRHAPSASRTSLQFFVNCLFMDVSPDQS